MFSTNNIMRGDGVTIVFINLFLVVSHNNVLSKRGKIKKIQSRMAFKEMMIQFVFV